MNWIICLEKIKTLVNKLLGKELFDILEKMAKDKHAFILKNDTQKAINNDSHIVHLQDQIKTQQMSSCRYSESNTRELAYRQICHRLLGN